tara:strand:+ start:182 stop:421 length:240 start_codon:yes stop_codon:yes gene_type:complete
MAKKYDTEFMDYNNANTYYVETFVNIKRIVKIKGITEKQAVLRSLKREQDRSWKNYEFVDCDYNVVDYNEFKKFKKGRC